MARKRQLDPEYPFEEEIAQLSIPARYFYILSWCHMDDTNGVLPYNIFKLKGQIFPTDNIDVGAIIQELLNMRRIFSFEADNKKWLWCPKLLHHQVINNPSRKKYPDPPKELKDDYRSGKLALTLSRVERVERVDIKEQPSAGKPVLNTPNIVDNLLKKIYKEDNFNIYALINKLKKQLKWGKDGRFPDEVLIGVCKQYEKDKARIQKPWPWFTRVMKAESERYFAEQNIKQGSKWKKQPIAQSMREIMQNITKGG